MTSLRRAVRSWLQLPLELAYRTTLGILRLIGFEGRGESHGTLLFKTDRIGDFVLASGLLHLIVDQLGSKDITLMVSQIVEPIAAREFPDCKIIPIPKAGDDWRGGLLSGWLKTRNRNAGRHYRRIVSLRHHPTLFEDLLLSSLCADDSLAVARTTVGESFWVRKLRSFDARHTFPYPTAASTDGCLELEAHRRLAEMLLDRPMPLAQVLPQLRTLTDNDDGPFLVLPHASDDIKNYPPGFLVEALLALSLPPQERIALCGERSRAAELDALAISLRARLPNAIEIEFPASLTDFVDTVSRSRCILGMDSAGAHIAVAGDKRGVFLLGGGHFRVFAPWTRSTRQQWLYSELECFGCDWTCTQPYVRCLHDIHPHAVATALRQVLASE